MSHAAANAAGGDLPEIETLAACSDVGSVRAFPGVRQYSCQELRKEVGGPGVSYTITKGSMTTVKRKERGP